MRDLSPSAVELPPLAAMHDKWEAAGRTTTKRRLQPILTANHGTKKFPLASSSYWYPPFATKMFGLAICFSVQIDETLIVDLTQMEPYFKVTISNCQLW